MATQHLSWLALKLIHSFDIHDLKALSLERRPRNQLNHRIFWHIEFRSFSFVTNSASKGEITPTSLRLKDDTKYGPQMPFWSWWGPRFITLINWTLIISLSVLETVPSQWRWQLNKLGVEVGTRLKELSVTEIGERGDGRFFWAVKGFTYRL